MHTPRTTRSPRRHALTSLLLAGTALDLARTAEVEAAFREHGYERDNGNVVDVGDGTGVLDFLAGTVAQLLSLGADAALKDKVRACTCIKTWPYTCTMRVYRLGVYIPSCYK